MIFNSTLGLSVLNRKLVSRVFCATYDGAHHTQCPRQQRQGFHFAFLLLPLPCESTGQHSQLAQLLTGKSCGKLKQLVFLEGTFSHEYRAELVWYINQNEAESCVYGRTAYISAHLPVPVLQSPHESILTKSSSTQTLPFCILFKSR